MFNLKIFNKKNYIQLNIKILYAIYSTCPHQIRDLLVLKQHSCHKLQPKLYSYC